MRCQLLPARSEQCPEGIVSISGENLRIFSPEQLGNMFNQTSIPLRYTPRKMLLHPQTRYLILVESDDDTYPFEEKQKVLENLKQTRVKKEESMETEEGTNFRVGVSYASRVTRRCLRCSSSRGWCLGFKYQDNGFGTKSGLLRPLLTEVEDTGYIGNVK